MRKVLLELFFFVGSVRNAYQHLIRVRFLYWVPLVNHTSFSNKSILITMSFVMCIKFLFSCIESDISIWNHIYSSDIAGTINATCVQILPFVFQKGPMAY